MTDFKENFVISSIVPESSSLAPIENMVAMSGAGFGFEFASKWTLAGLDTETTKSMLEQSISQFTT